MYNEQEEMLNVLDGLMGDVEQAIRNKKTELYRAKTHLYAMIFLIDEILASYPELDEQYHQAYIMGLMEDGEVKRTV